MSFVVTKGPYKVWQEAVIAHADAEGAIRDCEVSFCFTIPTDEEFDKEFPDRAALLGAISAGGDEAASDRSAIDAIVKLSSRRNQTPRSGSTWCHSPSHMTSATV